MKKTKENKIAWSIGLSIFLKPWKMHIFMQFSLQVWFTLSVWGSAIFLLSISYSLLELSSSFQECLKKKVTHIWEYETKRFFSFRAVILSSVLKSASKIGVHNNRKIEWKGRIYFLFYYFLSCFSIQGKFRDMIKT